MKKLRKLTKLLTAAMLLPLILSCAQSTGGDSSSGSSGNQESGEIVTKSSPYVLYDNHKHTNENGEILNYPSWKVYNEINKSISLPLNKNPEELTILKDFYFGPNNDLYCLINSYDEKNDQNLQSPSTKILKYTENDNYKNPTELLALNRNSNGPSLAVLKFNSIAYDDSNIYLGCEPGFLVLDKNNLNLDLTTDEEFQDFYNNNVYQLKNVTAIEVDPQKEVFVASVGNDKVGISKYVYGTDNKLTLSKRVNLQEAGSAFNGVTSFLITDLQYRDGLLYALVTENLFNNDECKLGGIVVLDTKEMKVVNEFGVRKTNTPWTPESTSLLSPRKFIAIKEKQLVITEEGFYDIDDSNKGIENNSVVTIDILSEGLKFNSRTQLENIDLNQVYYKPGNASAYLKDWDQI